MSIANVSNVTSILLNITLVMIDIRITASLQNKKKYGVESKWVDLPENGSHI